MRLAMALGAGLAALTIAGAAQSQQRIVLNMAGPGASADADNDGWISRAEAANAADSSFERLDSNDDNRLDAEDRRAFTAHLLGPGCEYDEEGEGDERRVEVRCERTSTASGQDISIVNIDEDNCTREESGDENDRRVVVRCVNEAGEGGNRRVLVRPTPNGDVRVIRPGGEDDNCRREETNENGQRRVTVTCTGSDGERTIDTTPGASGDRIERRSGESVWVEAAPLIPPIPLIPPVPPIPMAIAFDGEADLNGDGGLSREEFRAQQLRYFDASDVNDDGRIQAPPRPPEPPMPPAPPEPPRRR